MVGGIAGRRKRAHLFVDCFQLRFRLHIADAVGFFRLLGLLADQIADADTEKFIEIALEDRGEAKPFQQRIALRAGFLQHASVKAKPR